MRKSFIICEKRRKRPHRLNNDKTRDTEQPREKEGEKCFPENNAWQTCAAALSAKKGGSPWIFLTKTADALRR